MQTGINMIGELIHSFMPETAKPASQGQSQLMTLGDFVFQLSTLAYEQLQRQNNWRHVNNDPVGADPAYQFTGAGEESFTISGVMYAEFGNRKDFDTIREMADCGEAYVLIDATGKVYGMYAIIELSESGTFFDKEGVPKKTEFSINLTRVSRGSGHMTGSTSSTSSTSSTRSA